MRYYCAVSDKFSVRLIKSNFYSEDDFDTSTFASLNNLLQETNNSPLKLLEDFKVPPKAKTLTKAPKAVTTMDDEIEPESVPSISAPPKGFFSVVIQDMKTSNEQQLTGQERVVLTKNHVNKSDDKLPDTILSLTPVPGEPNTFKLQSLSNDTIFVQHRETNSFSRVYPRMECKVKLRDRFTCSYENYTYKLRGFDPSKVQRQESKLMAPTPAKAPSTKSQPTAAKIQDGKVAQSTVAKSLNEHFPASPTGPKTKSTLSKKRPAEEELEKPAKKVKLNSGVSSVGQKSASPSGKLQILVGKQPKPKPAPSGDIDWLGSVDTTTKKKPKATHFDDSDDEEFAPKYDAKDEDIEISLGSEDSESEEEDELLSKDSRPWCRYGSECYQTNPEHKKKFRHPQ